MAKERFEIIPSKDRLKGQMRAGIDGVAGGLIVGIASNIIGLPLGNMLGGVIGGAMTGNPVVTVNGVMDGVTMLFMPSNSGSATSSM